MKYKFGKFLICYYFALIVSICLGSNSFPEDVQKVRIEYEKDPMIIQHYLNRGFDLANDGKYFEASKLFKTVLPVSPDNVPNEIISKIDEIYEKALINGGKPSILHNARGFIRLFYTRNYEEAIIEFDQSLKDDEKNEEALWGLGWAQSHLGKSDEAQKVYEKQLSVSDEKSEVADSTRFSLMNIYLDQGDLEKTLLHFKKAARNAWKRKDFVFVKEIMKNDKFRLYLNDYCKRIWHKGKKQSNRQGKSCEATIHPGHVNK